MLTLMACTAAADSDAVPAAEDVVAAPGSEIFLDGELRQGGYARGKVPLRTSALRLDDISVPITADGGFFIAFGRDVGREVELVATLADGCELRRVLSIADTDFPEEHLPPIHRKYEADPEFERRRAIELSRIRAAREHPSAEVGWQDDFIWPVNGRISGVFGSQRFFGQDARSPHSGTDLAAPPGTPVRAPAGGRIVLASPPLYSLEGNLVILDHGLGLYSAFLHLQSVDVKVGQNVVRGDPIGTVGSSGRATGPHLHWGLYWQGIRFDPQLLVAQNAD